MANLINAGILPLTFSDPDDYDSIEQGHKLTIQDIRSAMDSGTFLLTDGNTGKQFVLNGSFTQRQKAILMAGGLLNYTKECEE